MKSLMTTGLLVASLALSGNAAMAANTATHKHINRYAPMATHVTQRLPQDQFGAGLGQFIQSMFGGGVPMRYARSQSSYHQSGASESFDSSPSVDTSSNDAQAASDAEAQAIQSMNDTNAMNASMAAAEAQNEAAQAAAIQTEINANN
ncbi:MAG: hypothetical protein ABI192_02340 [Bradyrhizobium sp.]